MIGTLVKKQFYKFKTNILGLLAHPLMATNTNNWESIHQVAIFTIICLVIHQAIPDATLCILTKEVRVEEMRDHDMFVGNVSVLNICLI